MMKLLVRDNFIIAHAHAITYGMYEGEEKWELTDENGNLLYYVIDGGFTLIEGVELPEDYEDGKYFFENGEFVLDETWKQYIPIEERVRLLEEANGGNIWDELAGAIEEGVNEV